MRALINPKLGLYTHPICVYNPNPTNPSNGRPSWMSAHASRMGVQTLNPTPTNPKYLKFLKDTHPG